MNRDKILDTRTTVSGLCKLAKELGYKDPAQQLMNPDGSCIGDLLCFFEDNPGAIDAVIEFAAKSYGKDNDEEEIEEDENVEDEE